MKSALLMKEKSCLCCAFQDECTIWITPNVGCSAAKTCKDGSEEEEKSEGSGEITGLLCWAATLKVKVIKAELKLLKQVPADRHESQYPQYWEVFAGEKALSKSGFGQANN